MFKEKQTRREFFKLSSITLLSLTQLPKLFNVNNIEFLFGDDPEICRKKFKVFLDEGLKDKPIGDAIVEIGKSFLGAEYTAGTLEINSPNESLVVNLREFDCVTFVETCLAFAGCLKYGVTNYDGYQSKLKNIRYRDGKIDGYASRLHYFCDWIYDNENKGFVKNISFELGEEYNKTIDFMSTHAKSYKQLSDKNVLESIKTVEDSINSRYLYYVPKKNIAKIQDQLQNGDIIATTTSINGLDVTHTGYVYKGDDGGTYFLHASSKSKEVIISDNSLADYVAEDSKKTGIMVARPV